MTTVSAETKDRGGTRVAVQRFGSFLSGMIMPNIPALIAWGIITALFIEVGPFPNEALASIVGPMIHYLLPILIAMQGGRMIYDTRGAVVGAIATMGVIAGSDWLVAQFNATLPEGAGELGQVHMFIGAMIMGPLGAYAIKQLDKLWEGKIKSGFEMLVNMFSAGIGGFLLALAGFYWVAPAINALMDVMGNAVRWLIETNLLPLTSVIIEPAKVFFLNNAINHGVLTPLGIADAAENGQSILFLLEANPGPGFGVLLAFSIFGTGIARATAPGALLIQFVGGIHEVYFPYVLMKPALLIAMIAGGATGVGTNMVFESGLRAPAAPGSIIAVVAQTAQGSYVGVILSVILSATVTFSVASVILLSSRKRDLAANEDSFAAAVAKTEANKGRSSSHLANLSAATQVPAQKITNIIFACDAGMGSSAMGASVLRKKISGAGIEGVTVTNKAVASLPGDADLVITQQQLTDRARAKEPQAVHVSVDSFMNAPEYDDVVTLIRQSEARSSGRDADDGVDSHESSAGGVAMDTRVRSDSQILTRSQVRIHTGSATQDEALTEAAEILGAAGAVTEEYLRAMKEREATVSTYMGNELAIPHGTNDAKSAVLASALSVTRYDGGVDWAGEKVTFVIGIAGVGDEHLEILSKIAELFSDDAEVAKLKQASSEEELLTLLSAVNAG
ncbi:PTS mannitol transporter subunit IICBA [Nesterenkonia sp. LB17]|uniref:PTS mannitol transporter subunit IICBA n=1 Tax=unclassified Nesterenkonia TaxID=2629769 RepID=UPI001F4CC4A2|nr:MULTISPECIES: PTS mannitol transporter subunit IICBA [unclassified Nesterenkonia]MCH8560472.1 PTS mannitol transporter subunit IICBA [Nesterenkonia sp. DZ6]MCH8562739.1 PTS mannitol transporter subunit IICBA [Nesterenkonia sp. YGD6]MCH8565788.1 PTS mannitol transporter subunit IICBA [Nesterenkonia sp. LB17]MCH8570580.1 PTS mannitol transporter subunit IICBA [Nesterenkonia sp. AY15]